MATTLATKTGGDRGNANAVLFNGDPEIIRFATPLTAIRTCTLSRSPDPGDRFYVLRESTATGAFALNIIDPNGGSTIKTLSSAGTFAHFYYSDALGWRLVAAGSL